MLVVAHKIDAIDDPDRVTRLEAHVRERELPFFKASAATGEGIDVLLEAIWREVAAARQRTAESSRQQAEAAGIDSLVE
jgi:50S ribosomal subunit-associated GTPase HflX